jgi:hypothetical protein
MNRHERRRATAVGILTSSSRTAPSIRSCGSDRVTADRARVQLLDQLNIDADES